jgi:hypothetical protein
MILYVIKYDKTNFEPIDATMQKCVFVCQQNQEKVIFTSQKS